MDIQALAKKVHTHIRLLHEEQPSEGIHVVLLHMIDISF